MVASGVKGVMKAVFALAVIFAHVTDVSSNTSETKARVKNSVLRTPDSKERGMLGWSITPGMLSKNASFVNDDANRPTPPGHEWRDSGAHKGEVFFRDHHDEEPRPIESHVLESGVPSWEPDTPAKKSGKSAISTSSTRSTGPYRTKKEIFTAMEFTPQYHNFNIQACSLQLDLGGMANLDFEGSLVLASSIMAIPVPDHRHVTITYQVLENGTTRPKRWVEVFTLPQECSWYAPHHGSMLYAGPGSLAHFDSRPKKWIEKNAGMPLGYIEVYDKYASKVLLQFFRSTGVIEIPNKAFKTKKASRSDNDWHQVAPTVVGRYGIEDVKRVRAFYNTNLKTIRLAVSYSQSSHAPIGQITEVFNVDTRKMSLWHAHDIAWQKEESGGVLRRKKEGIVVKLDGPHPDGATPFSVAFHRVGGRKGV